MLNTSIRDDFTYMSSVLDSIQYNKYEGYYKFPQSTLPITDKIYGDLFRIFKTTDRNEDIRISKPEDKEEYTPFYKEFQNWLKSTGYSIYRERTCNLVFIDMPLEGEGAPRYHEVDIHQCVDYSPIKNGLLSYALFDNGNGYIWVDSEKWMFFAYKDNTEQATQSHGNTGVELGVLIAEVRHDLGITPCLQFWSDNFDNDFNKETAISRNLANLSIYDRLDNGKDHNDMVNIFPDRWNVRQECDYMNKENTQKCSNGFLVDSINGAGRITSDNRPVVCPDCQGGNSYMYAGVTLLVDPATAEVSQTTQPAGYVTVDPKVLEHINAELANREQSIVSSSLGDDISDNNQAKNKDQILLSTESRTAKYMKVAKGFETFEENFITITAMLWFGDTFESVNISYGQKWHLATVEQLEENFTNSANSGMPLTILLNDLDRIVDAKFKNDQLGKEEAKLWLTLEPFRGKSFEQVKDLREKGLITTKEWEYYKFFPDLMAMFNNEFGSILNFRPELAPATRLMAIRGQLFEWLAVMVEMVADPEPVQEAVVIKEINND